MQTKNDLSHIFNDMDNYPVGSEEHQKKLDELSLHTDLECHHLQLYSHLPWKLDLLSRNTSINTFWIGVFPNQKWDFQAITNTIFEANPHNSRIYYFNTTIDMFGGLKDNIKTLWLQQFPQADWNFELIFKSNKLSLKMLQLIPVEKHNYQLISSSDNLDISWLQTFPEGDWDFKKISLNPNLNPNILSAYSDKPWDFKLLPLNPGITLEWLDLFPNQDWCFIHDKLVESNLHLPSETLTRFTFKLRWFYHNIFLFEWYEKHPSLEWNFEEISRLHSLKLQNILDYPHEKWDFKVLCNHPDMNLEFLKSFPGVEWDFGRLSRNKNLQLQWVDTFPQGDWNFGFFHMSENFKAEWICRFPNKNWNLKKFYDILKPQEITLVSTHYQYYHPETSILDILIENDTDQLINNSYIWNLLKKQEVNIPIYLINPDLAQNENFHKLLTPDILAYPKLTDSQKLNLLEFLRRGLKFNPLVPEIFSYPDCDLELVDLSGNVFYLSNWFRCESIMDEIHHTFPDLADIDVMVNDDIYDVCIMGSKSTNKQLIEKICQNKGGPSAMIVYPDIQQDKVEPVENELNLDMFDH